jgi:hypothetical protein
VVYPCFIAVWVLLVVLLKPWACWLDALASGSLVLGQVLPTCCWQPSARPTAEAIHLQASGEVQVSMAKNVWQDMTRDHIGNVDLRPLDQIEALVYDSEEEEQGRAIVCIRKVYRSDPDGVPFEGDIMAASDRDYREWFGIT